MDDTLKSYFNKLDKNLSELGQSDSTIEYAPHAREPFDKVINNLNEIRTYLGGDSVRVSKYFGTEEE